MSGAGDVSGTAGRQSLGTLGEVEAIIAGEPTRALAALAPDTAVRRVVTDTRAGIARGDLFVALPGPSFDGADFVERALADGAAAAIVARDSVVDEGWPVWRVDDPLAALQRLAGARRARYGGTVVAVTGSNGKTTVKEMLASVFSPTRRVSSSPMSWNSQLGVARSLLEADLSAEVWFIECGISQPGEMVRLAEMVRPDLGVLVGIGDVHLEGLGSREGVAREKVKLFEAGCRRVWMPEGVGGGLPARLLEEAGVEVRGVSVGALPEGAGDVADWLEAPHRDVPFFREDARLVAAVASALGIGVEAIEEGLRAWVPAEMRLEWVTTPRGVLVINDAYTSDPGSLEGALQLLVRERTSGRAVAVLGGLAEQGEAMAAGLARVGVRLAATAVDVVAVGEGGARIADAAVAAGLPSERVVRCAGHEDAARWLDAHCGPGDRVLLKGARPERLEHLLGTFFESLAPARMVVDLRRLQENYREVKRRLAPGVELLAVLKAFGYGIDAVRLALALEAIGADCFGVAYPDEGVLLRERGITTPILVQNISRDEIAKVVRHGLIAQVSTADQVLALEREAARHGVQVRVHLKVDTGMGRSGVRPDGLGGVLDSLAACSWLLLDGVMTHLASSEDAGQDEATVRQLAAFESAVQEVRDRGFDPRRIHACNSSGIARFPDGHGTMVRLGLGLLGCADPRTQAGLGTRPVVRLETRVLSVRDLPAGAPVGYGRSWTAARDSRIAVVAIGYADGLPWSLSNAGWMWVRDRRAPIVGRVCMDVTMLDVTDIDGVVEGDRVIVHGEAPAPTVPEVAEQAGTIPYEILTRIAPRVRRIFLTDQGG
ncbi:MAG: alanine racemase [Deltaproteobacteria bacterium]|nr:MAG: alanine racemase [Deltaproteobacteria bacterium]